MSKILLVDDDLQALNSTRRILDCEGYDVHVAYDGEEALKRLRENDGPSFDLIISDIRMPKLSGLEFLKAQKATQDPTPVILMTAYGRIEDAVWAMKFGACDFLTKPFKRQALLSSVKNVLRKSKLTHVNPLASGEGTLIGTSPRMMELKGQIQKIALSNTTILIQGASGTGKELVAKQIHTLGSRSERPYIAINCAAFPENLIESELFGYEKGAFSGATQSRKGLFEAAHSGTLFLDEVGDMPLSTQCKLLRVLQEGVIRRLGSTENRKFDVRVIAATHRDLKKMIQEGRFREDLFFRLNVVDLNVPSLSERPEDILVLTGHFLEKYRGFHNKPEISLGLEASYVLERYSWPGNVRELENMIERSVVLSAGNEISTADLPDYVSVEASFRRESSGKSIEVPLGTPLRDIEDMVIKRTLDATQGDKKIAAKILGINSRTVHRRVNKTES